MKLTPLDIRRQEFKRVVRGVDPEEVGVFLDMVAGEYERILREAKALGEERDELKRKVDEFDSMRDAIQGAVVMARKSADETINQAKKEAELRFKEAEVESERLLEDARRQASLLRREMDDIRNQRSILVGRLKSLLDGQMKMLEAYVGDWGQDERRHGEADRQPEGTSAARRAEESPRFDARMPSSSRTPWAQDASAHSSPSEYARHSGQADSHPHNYDEHDRAAEQSERSGNPEATDIIVPSARYDHAGNRLDESLRTSSGRESSGGRKWMGDFRPGLHHPARTPEGAQSPGSRRSMADSESSEGGVVEGQASDGAGGREAAEKPGRAPEPRIRELTPRQMK